MMLALIFVNAALESIICFKMSTGLFEVSAPMLVKVPWMIVLSSLLVFAIVYFPFLSPPITEIASGAEGAQPIVKKVTKAN